MTFDARERSAADGRPIELFTFARDYQTWRYTSADRDIVVNGATFLARAISRTEVQSSAEMAKSGVKVTAPRDLEVADLFRISPPTLTITLIIQQFHEGDGELATIWTGRVANVDWAGLSAIIACDPVYTALRRVGLRRTYQKGCPHVLYGSECRAPRDAFKVAGVASNIGGFVVQVPAAESKPDGWFAGGFIEYAVELGIIERRFIADHTGDLLTLNGAPYGLSVGESVLMFPGCNHTLDDCVNKFDNVLNYGGFPYFPIKNPFGGDPIY